MSSPSGSHVLTSCMNPQNPSSPLSKTVRRTTDCQADTSAVFTPPGDMERSLDSHCVGMADAPPQPTTFPPMKDTDMPSKSSPGRNARTTKDPAGFDVGSGGETHQRRGRGEPQLTTAHGTPISDDQNSLKVGERGPTLLNDFVMREKVFHFDHERIPERCGSRPRLRGPWLLRNLRAIVGPDEGGPVPTRRPAHPRLCPFLDSGRQQGIGRSRSRCPRLRREVLHPARQLGSRRQQHSGVLRAGRHEVSRPRARSEGRADRGFPSA